MRYTKILTLSFALALLAACDFPANFGFNPDEQFGDQNFKSAIAMIELHKVRNGTYPDKLGDLKYLGQWDQIWLSGVEYEKVGDGYNLNVIRGWVGKPELDYDAGFWQGLGIKESNVKVAAESSLRTTSESPSR